MHFISVIKERTYRTKRRLEFKTITKDVEELITKTGMWQGVVVVQTHHTTCRLWLNEDEKNLIGTEGDLSKALDRFASPQEEYGHNDIKDARNPHGKRDTHLCAPDEQGVCHECVNGHSHAQALMLPASVSMIVHKGKLVKGSWQELMLIELDHDRERKISVLVQGIKRMTK